MLGGIHLDDLPGPQVNGREDGDVVEVAVRSDDGPRSGAGRSVRLGILGPPLGLGLVGGAVFSPSRGLGTRRRGLGP